MGLPGRPAVSVELWDAELPCQIEIPGSASLIGGKRRGFAQSCLTCGGQCLWSPLNVEASPNVSGACGNGLACESVPGTGPTPLWRQMSKRGRLAQNCYQLLAK